MIIRRKYGTRPTGDAVSCTLKGHDRCDMVCGLLSQTASEGCDWQPGWNYAKVWEDGQRHGTLLTLRGRGNVVWSVAFSPDGQRIVTGCSDHRASVWDTSSGTELFTLTGHRGGVMSVAYSPEDGLRLIVTGASDDNTAKSVGRRDAVENYLRLKDTAVRSGLSPSPRTACGF